jgi:pilus assembly protein CpaC
MKVLIPTLLGGLAWGVVATLAPNAALAGEPQAETASHGGVLTRRLSMGVGKTIIVDLPRDASEILIGNPGVANAIVRSARKLYVIGIKNGQTSVYAMDRDGRQIAVIEISIGRDIGELTQIIKAAMPNSAVIARTVNNTIILQGSVESASDASQVIDIAKGFVTGLTDGGGGGGQGTVVNALTVRGRDQVSLKVTIAEVRRDVAKQLGLTASTIAGGWGSIAQDNPLSLNLQKLSNGALQLGNPASKLNATISAFERYGVSRILAEPTVTAVSGESAKFTAGGEVPVPSGSSCATDANGRYTCTVGVSYKPYGITLNFTPVVLSEGRIMLRLATEVTELDTQTTVQVSGINVAGLRTRKHETTVELPSGGSIASAGLIQNTSRQVINGLPGLMNLPILGSLFRSRDYQRQETELMIIVTPYIVKPTTASALVRPDENFTDTSDAQAMFLGRVNKLYSTQSNPVAVQQYKGRVGFIQD